MIIRLCKSTLVILILLMEGMFNSTLCISHYQLPFFTVITINILKITKLESVGCGEGRQSTVRGTTVNSEVIDDQQLTVNSEAIDNQWSTVRQSMVNSEVIDDQHC